MSDERPRIDLAWSAGDATDDVRVVVSRQVLQPVARQVLDDDPGRDWFQ